MKTVPVIRTLAALVLLAASGAASAYIETHINEITTPVADYAAVRTAALAALPTRTKAEKRELAQLKALMKPLAKTQLVLKGDFAELVVSGKSYAALGAAGAPMKPALDEAFLRAQTSLTERAELAQDHLDLLLDAKHKKSVQTLLTSLGTTRTKAAAATSAAKRASLLASADALVTKALKTAEKFVVKDRGAEFLPPPRLRSGDAIDLRGGRVAVPRDAASPVAGASIVIPSGLFQTPVIVTLSAAPSFVGGRDVAAWTSALAVSPDGLALGDAATVYVPFQLAPDQPAQNLALFAAGPPQTPLAPVTTHADGTLSAQVSAFSTFQAGVAAPPPGQPGGAYHVQMLVLDTAVDATNKDLSGVRAGILQETITFKFDHTASTSAPGFPTVSRTFLSQGPPHHHDDAQTPFLSSVDFTWAATGVGRFSFAFPLAAGVTAQADGVASDDGRVIAFTGHGGAFEFFGVGVKAGAGSAVADLAGRWAAVETGVQFLNDGAEPFTTRYFDAFRSFNADAGGVVTFDAGGARFETDVTYRTDQSDPIHAHYENVLADAGSETWTVSGGDGFVVGAQNLRFGWFDKDAGFLVSAYYDPAARRASMMLAVPQPAQATPSALLGAYHFAQFEIGTTAGSPTARSSTHEATSTIGTLDVRSTISATLSLDATKRDVYTLSGEPPASAMTWTLSAASTDLAASSTPLVLSLDAAGNHRVASDPLWFAFAGDGRYVLGMSRGESTRLARGLAVGVK